MRAKSLLEQVPERLIALGELLQQRRRQLGRTQRDVAEAVGISEMHLANMEAARVEHPGAHVIEALADALALDAAQAHRLAESPSEPPLTRAWVSA